MLLSLQIDHFQLLERVDLEIEDSFLVVTGESGSGKSSLLGAIAAGLGFLRAEERLIQKGAPQASIELHFDVARLGAKLQQELRELRKELELDPEEERLILSRTFHRDKPSKAQIDRKHVPTKKLQSLGLRLVEILNQHAGQELTKEAQATHYVDAYAKNSAQREALRCAFQAARALKLELARLEQLKLRAKARIDLLEEEKRELDESMVDFQQEEELFSRFRQTQQRADERALLERLAAHLERIEAELGSIKRVGAEPPKVLKEALSTLESAWQDSSWELERLLEQTPSAQELEELSKRLERLERLQRKYGSDLNSVTSYRERLEEELHELYFLDERLERVRSQSQEAEVKLQEADGQLRSSRKEAALHLSEALTKELQELNFEGAKAFIELQDCKQSQEGSQEIFFKMRSTASAQVVSLHQEVSGGERARFYLALKLVCCEEEPPPLLILDEIDASLGGISARKMQEKLKKLSSQRQILCITHFPQVARGASVHLSLRKEECEGKTTSEVVKLNSRSQREKELERMIGEQP